LFTVASVVIFFETTAATEQLGFLDGNKWIAT
jgi:hypothetical protein